MAKDKIATREKPGAIKPLEDWEREEMAHAKDVRSKETLGVPRIQHRGGEFKVDQQAIGRSIKLVIVDWRMEKDYFESAFDASKPATPDCYAFGTEEKAMRPHEMAPHKQNDACAGCKHNAFNTANPGRGKRCKDYRKLLVISPMTKDGKAIVDPEMVQKAEKRTMQVPPASLKNFGNFLTSLKPVEEGGLGLTRTGSASEMVVQVDTYALDNGGHGLKFTPAGQVDREALRAIVAVRQGSADLLTQPYPVIEADEAPKAPARGSKSNKKLD